MEKKKLVDRVIWIIVAIIMVVAVIISCASCENVRQVNVVNNNDTIPEEIIKIVEFGYDGHDYIEFVTRGCHCSIVHSPDCHCMDECMY